MLYEIEPELRDFLATLNPSDLARADFAACLLAEQGPDAAPAHMIFDPSGAKRWP